MNFHIAMLSSIITKADSILNGGSERSRQIVKNVILSFGVKGGSIVISLLLVPMTITYISPVKYGIWLTISSIVSWMSFFDIGLGNGLRNNLSKALAEGNYSIARTLVSTTYSILAIISTILFFIAYFIIPQINWLSFLNIASSFEENITTIVLIVFSTFCLQFVVQIVNTILTAIHQPSKAALILFIGQLGVLIGIALLKLFVPGSLTVMVWILTLIPIAVLIISSIYLFSTELKSIRPSFQYTDLKYAKRILNTGVSFFIIQIGAMMLFQSNNIIITKILGPLAVTEFNVSFKLFSIVTMAFNIIITPYWSAFTDAYVKKDWIWIEKSLLKIKKIWILLSVLSIAIAYLSKPILKIWVGDSITVNTALVMSMTLYTISYMWHAMHAYMLNGIGHLRVQLVLICLGAVINIPLAIYLGQNYGLWGVVTSNTIIFLIVGVTLSIQARKIVKQTDHGIWSR